MAEVRETHVERDEHGNVTDTKVKIERPKRRGGFGWGMLVGVLLIAGAIIAFAYSQGSFQRAGVEADQATAQIETQTNTAIDNAEQAAGDTSDTATN